MPSALSLQKVFNICDHLWRLPPEQEKAGRDFESWYQMVMWNSSSLSAIKVSYWVCITYTHMQLPTVFLVYFCNFLILFYSFFLSSSLKGLLVFPFLYLLKMSSEVVMNHSSLAWELVHVKIPNIIHPGMMMLMMLVVNYSYSLMRNTGAFVVK